MEFHLEERKISEYRGIPEKRMEPDNIYLREIREMQKALNFAHSRMKDLSDELYELSKWEPAKDSRSRRILPKILANMFGCDIFITIKKKIK